MKFAHYLKDVREEAPPALRDTFLDYKLLKKDLKALREAKGDGEEEKKTFFKHLEAQISDVNEKFQSCATSMIETFDKSHDRTAFMQFCDKLLCHMLTHKNDDGKSQQLMELADKAEWCRRYANINAVALRKIVKKYDKVVHSHEGHQWLQAYWSGNKQDEAMFLHSPLLMELKAVEVLLGHEQVRKGEEPPEVIQVELSNPDQPDQPEMVDLPHFPSEEFLIKNSPPVEVLGGEGGHLDDDDDNPQDWRQIPGQASTESVPRIGRLSIQGGGSGAAHASVPGGPGPPEPAGGQRSLSRTHSMASSGLTDDIEEEYKCHICLEPMYHPLGLGCGHTFCADCAFCAVGKAYSLGTVRAIMLNTPDTAACPECRKPGVFRTAHEMKSLGRVIKNKYPAAWAAKREEMKKKEAHLRQLLQKQRAAELGVFLPYS